MGHRLIRAVAVTWLVGRLTWPSISSQASRTYAVLWESKDQGVDSPSIDALKTNKATATRRGHRGSSQHRLSHTRLTAATTKDRTRSARATTNSFLHPSIPSTSAYFGSCNCQVSNKGTCRVDSVSTRPPRPVAPDANGKREDESGVRRSAGDIFPALHRRHREIAALCCVLAVGLARDGPRLLSPSLLMPG